MENVSVEEAARWRNQLMAIDEQENHDFAFLDPTRRLHKGGQEEVKQIFRADIRDIEASDYVVANLTGTDKTPAHGTAMEIFFASYVLRLPVIAIKEEFTRYHPFFESLVSHWVGSVEEAYQVLQQKLQEDYDRLCN